MVKLQPFSTRQIEFKEAHLGRVLLFCEGKTEENYFTYFADIIDKNRNKYSQIEVVPVLAAGNARTVLNFADKFLEDEKNLKQYSLFNKYLVFDCDDPDDIEAVITDIQSSSNSYFTLLSNLLFETWLLMHFEHVSEPLSKRTLYQKMALALNLDKYGSKQKASKGIIRQIIGSGKSIRYAIQNATELAKKYEYDNLKIGNDIGQMNPFTEVYLLMASILTEMNNAG